MQKLLVLTLSLILIPASYICSMEQELIRPRSKEKSDCALEKSNWETTVVCEQGNSDYITDVIFSDDNSRVTVFADNTATVYCTVSGKRLASIVGERDHYRTTKFNNKRTRIITHYPANASAQIWNVGGLPICCLTGHTKPIIKSVFSQDDARLITGSEDGTAKIWDPETGQLLLTLQGHTGAITSAGFDTAVTKAFTFSESDGTVRIWDARTGVCKAVLCHNYRIFKNYPIRECAFSPSGDKIASYDSQTLKIWDTETTQCKLTLADAHLYSFRFNEQGNQIITTRATFGDPVPVPAQDIKIFDMTGKCIIDVPEPDRRTYRLSPHDNKIAVASGNVLRVYNTCDGKCILTDQVANPGGWNLAHWDNEENKLLVIFNEASTIFNTATGSSIRRPFRQNPAYGFTFDKESGKVLYFSMDSTIGIMSADDGSIELEYNLSAATGRFAYINPSATMMLIYLSGQPCAIIMRKKQTKETAKKVRH